MAAGFSRRFGEQNKLLVPFRGKPLVCHAIDLVCDIGCFEGIFFVYADKAVAALARNAVAAYPPGLPFTLVHNPSPEKGQGESALLGLRATVHSNCHHYLFLPCDQPLLDAATLRLLLDAARPGCIVEPGSGKGENRSPTIFSASFRDELLALRPGENPRLLKSRHPQAIITVEVPNPAVLKDIDTPADLGFFANILTPRHGETKSQRKE